MKNITLAILVLLLVVQAKSQQITFAGMQGGVISQKKLLDENNILKIKNDEGRVVSFAVTAKIGGFDESHISNSNHLTISQRNLIKKVVGGERIIFEAVKIKLKNNSIIKGHDLVYKIRGLQAYVLGGYAGTNDLLKSKQLYVANNYLEDTCEYKIVSMKISSTQYNYHYELESDNNKLTHEMVNFVRRASKNFYIYVKAMNIQTGITKRLKPLEIDVYLNIINRTKHQLLKSKKLSLISPSSKLKITSFNLYKNMYQNEEDFMASSSNKLTKEMKTYIKTLTIGDVVRFSIEYTDILGENKGLYLDVRIVE